MHQATWADGRTVAVQVQYPGADEALRSNLRQIGRLSKVFAPLAGGMDVSALVDELTARVTEELDYTSKRPPSSRRQLASQAAEVLRAACAGDHAESRGE